ncbi:MAG: hypothetical protein ACOY3Y_06150 [Acidobacteriota bacterium]
MPYLLGLAVALFGGTPVLLVLATRAWHPGPESGQGERLLFGAFFTAVALGGWAVLASAYRCAVPVSCRRCGGRAHTVSLNPVEFRCPECGEIETVRFRVHGAR